MENQNQEQQTNTPPVTPAATQTPPPTTTETTPPKATETVTEVKTGLEQTTKEAKITKAVEPPPAPVVEEVKAPVKPNYDGMIQGFIDGNLTDEDYAAIEKSGLSRQSFELMAQGHMALQEKHTAELHAVVGGPEAYKQLQEFGAHNLNQSQIDAFNYALESGDPALAEIAVLGLQAKMMKAQGSNPPERVEANGSISTQVDAYETQQDVIRAMSDRRYGKDQAYTQEVNAKRARSAY